MTVSPNSLQSPLYEDEEKKVLGTVNSGWAQAGGQFPVPSSQFPVPSTLSSIHQAPGAISSSLSLSPLRSPPASVPVS